MQRKAIRSAGLLQRFPTGIGGGEGRLELFELLLGRDDRLGWLLVEGRLGHRLMQLADFPLQLLDLLRQLIEFPLILVAQLFWVWPERLLRTLPALRSWRWRAAAVAAATDAALRASRVARHTPADHRLEAITL
jgi:hypothetical protein